MTDAQATALAFDLKRLDPAFLDDPFPSTGPCASTLRFTACRTARTS